MQALSSAANWHLVFKALRVPYGGAVGMAGLITALTSLAAVAVGALLAYRNSDTLHRRQQWLARVNLQLAEFYGPLYAISETSRAAYFQFRSSYRPGRQDFFYGAPPTEDEIEAWKHWVLSVFMPANRRMYEIIVTKSHLVIEDDMPSYLLDLCAHVATWEVVLRRWSEGDYSQLDVPIPWPPGFREHVSESFNHLKSQQLKLLILVQPPVAAQYRFMRGWRRNRNNLASGTDG